MSLLYEDDFVSVNEMAIKVKNCLFPSKKAKCIPVAAIQVLWFEEHDRTKFPTRIWGKSQADVYWALDVKRCIGGPSQKFNVVIDVGQKFRYGFSVIDGESFMEAMRYALDYHVIIVDSINL
ncbi:unnamed protein product [Cylicocyclus nassatus]|uniref:Uncharacterized protein n=1 Tax=Cylicocyclus nassatus TaxID=53992 RepID=A0AA36DLW8_CYLNA|nr:unnamed protein product [Cylicocyclus nassatus]